MSVPADLVAVAVGPDFGAVGASGALAATVGALLTLVLVAAVLTLLVCAAVWAIATTAGNHRTAARARTGVSVAVVRMTP